MCSSPAICIIPPSAPDDSVARASLAYSFAGGAPPSYSRPPPARPFIVSNPMTDWSVQPPVRPSAAILFRLFSISNLTTEEGGRERGQSVPLPLKSDIASIEWPQLWLMNRACDRRMDLRCVQTTPFRIHNRWMARKTVAIRHRIGRRAARDRRLLCYSWRPFRTPHKTRKE